MAYRDDRQADLDRIAALEAELATAQDRIAELEGRKQTALVIASSGDLVPQRTAQARWLGAPLQLEMARSFDGMFPSERFEELVGRIRAIARERGRAELLRSSLTWHAGTGRGAAGPQTFVSVAVRDGRTTLTVNDRLEQLAGGLYGGLGGGLGGGGLMLPILAGSVVPWLAPVFVLGWLGGVFAGTRAIFKRAARRRAAQVQQLFDALEAEIVAAIRG